MHYLKTISRLSVISFFSLTILSCSKDKNNSTSPQPATITITNVLRSQPLVESGTFQGTGTPSVILPGQSVSIQFSAAKGQAITFATMYGWSNDLFFAPANSGILLYNATTGLPNSGDVSSQIKLWNNGTRTNQIYNSTTNQRPAGRLGTPMTNNISEVVGGTTMDAQGNAFLPASQLLQATLAYNDTSKFTLTIKNISGGTINQTPFSPGVWAVSYVNPGSNPITLQSPMPLYTDGQPTANGLVDLAEVGDNVALAKYVQGITGIFTPLSPVVVVVYNGISNPIFTVGQNDAGQGLKNLAQMGDTTALAKYLRTVAGVKNVYTLAAASTGVLLPMMGTMAAGSVSQVLTFSNGDKIAVATMYGFSNDWFFASMGEIDPNTKGDVPMGLFDDGTALNQFPGAFGVSMNLAGMSFISQTHPIAAVAIPGVYNTPPVTNIINVMLK